jgi:8-oxo-dGTP pyrophosphatase MutT (NUDIX family)
MPERHHHLTKETVHRALLRTAGLTIAPTYMMQMRTTGGRNVDRPTNPPPGVIATPAAVLILLYNHADHLHLVLTLRTTHLRSHAGQISFPGGRTDPEDESPYATALREAQEELNVDPTTLTLWTDLSTVYLPPSNYLIHPFVAYCNGRPEFQPNPTEVQGVIELPLGHLFLTERVATEQRELEGESVLVPHFLYGDQIIWGATAVILSQLVARIEAGLAGL